MTSSLLVVGHGTRDETGQRECAQLVDLVAERRPDLRVGLGFLELCPPPITDTVERLVAEGVDDVTVVPLVLLAAGHAKGDVPASIARERLQHPRVTFRYGRPLGITPPLLAAVEDRLAAAVPVDERDTTAVVVVGRGSSDPDANADLHKIARLLWEGRPWPAVEPAYVSLTQPSVPEALDRVRALGFRRVVVVPWFLFTGVLARRIVDQAHAWAGDHRDVAVRTADHLGVDVRVADLLLARHDEAVAGEAVANCDTCQFRVALPGFEDRVGQPQTLHHHPDDAHTHHHGVPAHPHP